MLFPSASSPGAVALSTHDSELSFSQTVPREYVHKDAVGEVLLTDSIRVADDQFLVAGQWPRRHWHFGEPARSLSLMLVAETFRQACLLVTCRHMSLDNDDRLVMDRIGLRLAGLKVRGGAPARVVMQVRTVRAVASSGRLRTIVFEADILADGVPIATAEGAGTIIPDPVYRRLRLPEPPKQTPTESRYPVPHLLAVDREHPVYFDHESDHVPGMLLVDVALSLTRTLLGSATPIRGFDATFDGFLEFEPPPRVRRTVETGPRHVRVDFAGDPERRAHVIVVTGSSSESP